MIITGINPAMQGASCIFEADQVQERLNKTFLCVNNKVILLLYKTTVRYLLEWCVQT